MTHTQKDSNDIIRLYKKCVEQKYRPSNFEKLEADMNSFNSTLDECLQAKDTIISYANLKILNDNVESYKSIPHFKSIIDRFNKASTLKALITNFLKNQTFKTRGGQQEEKLDVGKALDILKTADDLKVTFDNFDKFKDRVDEIVALMSEVDEFIRSDNNSKSIEAINTYLETLLDCGMETKHVMQLNRIRDCLEQIAYVEKHMEDVSLAQHNRNILENISQTGFATNKLVVLIDQCNTQIKWKRGFDELEMLPSEFQIDRFMTNELPTLLKIGKLYDLLKIPSQIKLTAEKKQLLERHKLAYGKIKQAPALTNLKDKLSMARDIYACKLADLEIETFLDSLKQELVFTQEVYSILQFMGVTNQLGPLHDIFEEKVIKPKNVSLEAIGQFLDKNIKFKDTLVFKNLEVQLSVLKKTESEALDAIESEDYQAIIRLEEWSRDNLAMQIIHSKLRECLDYSQWRKEVGVVVGRVRHKMENVFIDVCDKLDGSIADLEDMEDEQKVCQWYSDHWSTMKSLFKVLPEFEGFLKFERLNKLVHDEKNFQLDKDKELRTDLRQIKEHVDQLDVHINALSDYSDIVFVPRGLTLLGRSYILGVRTNLTMELVKKILYAAESEQASSLPTIEVLEDKLSVFSYLHLWTPLIAQMKLLKQWYRKTEEISEKIIARVTRQRVQAMSDIVEKMVLNVEDYEAKIQPDVFEISIKRKEREDPFSMRPRREKKRNQFYATRSLDNRPIKQNKELIEDIVFNDYTEQSQNFCICNRGTHLFIQLVILK